MQRLEHAADALGWHGYLIPDVTVRGARFTAVTRLRMDVHEWRRRHNWPPELDPSWFQSWSEPSRYDQLPLAAVDLLGALVPVSTADRALACCGNLLTLTPCTVILPGDIPYDPWPIMELDYYGLGVVRAFTTGPAKVLLKPEDRSTEFGPSPFSRWLLEVLYSAVLKRIVREQAGLDQSGAHQKTPEGRAVSPVFDGQTEDSNNSTGSCPSG